MIHSLALVLGGILLTPYAVGWFLRLTGAGLLWARVFMVVWLWSFTYWGTFYHSIKVGELFARLERNGR